MLNNVKKDIVNFTDFVDEIRKGQERWLAEHGDEITIYSIDDIPKLLKNRK